jgi:uncharacterized delta-60 repeat protein
MWLAVGLISLVTGSVQPVQAQYPLPDEFNPGMGGVAYAMAVQPDGKILVGGTFWYLAGDSRASIARLNQDGTLDAEFNPGASGYVQSLTVEPDGMILVGGAFEELGGHPRTSLGRLDANGILDAAFNPLVGGESSFLNSLLVQSDGKILVGGEFEELGGKPSYCIGRLNTDGTLDEDFNTWVNAKVRSLTVQADGKILVGGEFYELYDQFRSKFGRLNADGTRDIDFGAEADHAVNCTVMQADGRILVGGDFTMLAGQPRARIGRLHPDGTLEIDFDPGANAAVHCFAIQADGKILVGGDFTMLGEQPRSYLGRLNADGTLDESFNPGASSSVYCLALQADGKILVGGDFTTLGGQPRNNLGRLDNTSSATHSLTCDGTTVTWLRGGTSPEVWRTTFESSADGQGWMLLGEGSRLPGGWRLEGLALPGNALVRARGYLSGGRNNASGWFVEARSDLLQVTITSQPASRTNNAATTATFSALAAGAAPLTYQWYKNGEPLADVANLAGALTSSISISNVLQGDEGDYWVVVSNPSSSVTSIVATLTVLDPAITTQPVSQARQLGDAATFNVGAVGTAPFSYQWWKDGLPLAEATNSALTLSNLAVGHAGNYHVVVANHHASVTSLVAELTVDLATLDSGFNPGANAIVSSLSVQADGKVLVGGAFTVLGEQARNRIGRLNEDGTLDSGFNPGADNSVSSLALQPDGKIVVGGQFTTLGRQTRNYIGRLNPDGTLDSGFNPGANAIVNSLAVQADGKIVVAGAFTTLAGQTRNRLGRLNPDGTLDASFNPGVSWDVYCLALQEDGSILVGGQFTSLAGQVRKYIGRLNADGTLDTGFNPGADDSVSSLAVQADGKILVGGRFTTLRGQPRDGFGRLNPTGTLDTTFNPGANGSVSSLVLQADGKILVGGGFNTLGGRTRAGFGRLNSDGTVDANFNPGAGGDYPYVNSLALQPDGKVVVGGWFTALDGQPRNYIGRLNNTEPSTQSINYDGSTITWLRGGTGPEIWRSTFEVSPDARDWTLLGAGSHFAIGWQHGGISLPPDGLIRARGYVAGGYRNASSWFVEAYYRNGKPLLVDQPLSRTNDAATTATFSVKALGADSSGYQWFKDGVALVDGLNTAGTLTPTLLIGGVLKPDEGAYWVVASNALGSVTSAAGTLAVRDPVIVVEPASYNGKPGDAAVLSATAMGTGPLVYQWWKDGLLIAQGNTASLSLPNLQRIDAGYYRVVATNAFGGATSEVAVVTVNLVTRDEWFSPDLKLTWFSDPIVYSLAVQADGKILVGGSFTTLDGQTRNNIGRLNADGTLDASFNPDASSTVRSLAVQADGKILVGGDFTTLGGQTRNRIGRLNADGTLDASFNPGANSQVEVLRVQPDGKILVGGYFTTLGGQTRNRIGRLNEDGTLDSEFNPGVEGDWNEAVFSLAVQADGKILVGGHFATLGGKTCNHIARVFPDGSLDSRFWLLDRAVSPGADGIVAALTVQPDGKILVGGGFTTLGDEARSRIARLNADGTLDEAFDPGANLSVTELALQADGKILVSGFFTMLGGQLRTYLARLNADGKIDSLFNPGRFFSQYGYVGSLAVQPDGKILAGGRSSGYDHDPVLYRLNNTESPIESMHYNGSEVVWQRGGTGPEVWWTRLERSNIGDDWSSLGDGSRIPGGWKWTGISLGTDETIRARGYVSGTADWFVETLWRPSPDMQVVTLDTPLEGMLGSVQSLAWTIANLGSKPVTNRWVDRVYLSDDAMVGNDRLLGEFPALGPLNTNQALSRIQSVALPADLAPDRDYWWVVVTDAANDLDESNELNNARVSDLPMRIVRATLPNLRVDLITPPANPMSGQPVTVTWAVTNAGTWSTGAGLWQDAAYLSADGVLDAGDLLLGRVTRPRPLNTNESYASSLTAMLPQGLTGTRYFLVQTDADNRVKEGLGEADNTTASPPVLIALTPPPDLRVLNVEAASPTPPPAGSGGGSLQKMMNLAAPRRLDLAAISGDTIQVTWTVTNAGPGATIESAWVDEVYLAPTAELGAQAVSLGSFPRNGALASGDSYPASASVRLPIALSGPFYLLVHTDARNNVFEHNSEDNNVAATTAPISIILSPPPDLAVTAVDVPTRALASHPITVTAVVTNQGTDTLFQFLWEDRLYLSGDAVLDELDLPLASQWRWGALLAGESYTNTFDATLPDGLSGACYVIAETDTGNEVFELVKANNVRASDTPVLVESRPADLVVAALTVPASGQAGSSLLVSWMVENQGSGDTAVSRWNDRLVLSADVTLGNADDVILLTREQNGLLAAGASYTATNQVMTIPFSVAPGTWHLFAVADSGNAVYEAGNEGNNASASRTITITRTTADLSVASVEVTDLTGMSALHVLSEDTIIVSWRVDNAGAAAPNSSTWSDSIYLSTSAVWDTDAVLLGTAQNPASLAPGGAYTNAFPVRLPAEIQGEYYVHVMADAVVQVIEENRQNNTLVAAQALQVTLRPVPDLAVVEVQPPTDGFSGQLFELSWIVTNLGPASAEGTWFDSVYLSLDPQFEPALDTYIGYAERPHTLADGQSYTQVASLRVPANVSGLLYVFVVCDSTSRINERGARANNLGRAAQPVSVWIRPPSDLVVGTITIPDNAVSGYEMALTYVLHNQGTNAAFGPWVDALYLSTDEQWDIGDTLFTRLGQSGFLAAGDSRTHTVSAPAPGVVPGDYRVIIRTDVVNQVPETNEFNNITVSLDRVATQVEELGLGVPASNQLGHRQARYYRVHVTAGEWLVVELNCAAPSAATELYVRYDAIPTRSEFDFRHSSPLQPNQRIVVPNTREGDYYLLAYGDFIPAPGSAATTLLARLSQFLVFDTSFGKGGNAGNLTIPINGVDLDRTCTVGLTNAAGLDRPAVSHYYESSTRFWATLDLRDLEPGLYTVAVQNGNGSSVTIPDALEVAASGPPPPVAPSVSAPEFMRMNIAYTSVVRWANTGLNDAPAPLLTVGNTVPFGLRPGDYSLGTRYTFLGINTKAGPPGILRPGQSEAIVFHSFSDTTPGTYTAFADRVGKNAAEPVDWNRARGHLASDQLSLTNFDAVWGQFTNQIGCTWGDYLKMLSRNATLLPPGMGSNEAEGDLVRLEWQIALAAQTLSISGRVTSDSMAVDVGNLQVLANSTNGLQSQAVWSLTDGTFLVPDLPANQYALYLQGSQGWLPAPVLADTRSGQSVTNILLQLSLGAGLELNITDALGQPVKDALVTLGTSTNSMAGSFTDDHGVVNFAGLMPGEQVLLVQAQFWAPLVTNTTLVGGAITRGWLRLSAGSTMHGSVALPDASPATNFAVIAVPHDTTIGSPIVGTITNDQFALEALARGTYDLVVFCENASPFTLRDLVVPPEGDVQVPRIILSSFLPNMKRTIPDWFLSILAWESELYPPEYLHPAWTLRWDKYLAAPFPKLYWYISWSGRRMVTLEMVRRLTDADPDAMRIYKTYFDSLGPVPSTSIDPRSPVAQDFRERSSKGWHIAFEEAVKVIGQSEDFKQTFPCGKDLSKNYSIDGLINLGKSAEDRKQLEVYFRRHGPGYYPRPSLWTETPRKEVTHWDEYNFAKSRCGIISGRCGSWGLAGSIFAEVADYREVIGDTTVHLAADSAEATVEAAWSFIVSDAVDFLPGGTLFLLWQLARLESRGLTWDVPFTVIVPTEKLIQDFGVTRQSTCDPCNQPNPPDSCDDTPRPPSYDPNDIVGPSGFGPEYWISPDQTFHYTVRFENDAEKALAPAQIVRITHPLDPNLDLRTFRLGVMGFGTNLVEVPLDRTFYQTQLDLMDTFGIMLDISASLDLERGEVVWEFFSIDPETGDQPFNPFLGFLPPNTDGIIGQGFVTYTIKPKAGIAQGDIVNAEARIYFDYNEPIDTPRIFNTVDIGSPTSAVSPLPANTDHKVFLVQWTGEDVYGGSGIGGFDVYVSDDGSPWRLWLANTPYTEQLYVGEVGHTYSFYSIARDNVGHLESAPIIPSASTTVVLSDCAGFEADVAPRGNVNGLITVSDWVQVGRFAAGLDEITDPCEFQRADCAPRLTGEVLTGGNGQITVSDWVQAGRYAAGLDPVTSAAGPTEPLPLNQSLVSRDSSSIWKQQASDPRIVRLASKPGPQTGLWTAILSLDSAGGENALGFSVAYDPAALRYRHANLGSEFGQATLLSNPKQAGAGRLGFALALPIGETLTAGARSVLEIEFELLAQIPPSGGPAMNFAYGPVYPEIVDAIANTLRATWEDGSTPDLGTDEPPTTPPVVWQTSGLTVSTSAGVLTISWPAGLVGGVLETSSSVGPGSVWTPVIKQPQESGGTNSVRIESADITRFYRLRRW